MQLFRIIKKFRLILTRHQKLRILELGIIMVVGGFLEMFSVSLMLPFMEAVLEPDKIMANQFVKMICDLLGIQIYRTFLVFIALVLAVLFIVKNVFLLFELNVQNRFVANNQFATQCKLLENYVKRPYEFFLSVDSGEVLRVISSDTSQTFNLLSQMLFFFSEMVVSVFLIGTILVISPVITLAMAALLLSMLFIIMSFLKPRLKNATKESQKAQAGMNKWLLQTIQGIKELKVTQKEEFFRHNFEANGQVQVKTTRRTTTLSQIPRFMIEALSMSSFLVVIAVMIYKGMELESVVPVLSVVAMAAIRLLPSVNRISNSMAFMSSNEAYLDKMIENLNKASDINQYDKGTQPSATIKRLRSDFSLNNVSYRYPAGESDVLHNASMVIKEGESVGIVGQSGAGKTTVVDILLGLLRPYKGEVLVDGTDIRLDRANWLNQIGYIPQHIFMLDGTIRDNVAFGIPAEEIDDDKVLKALEEASLRDFVESLPDNLDTALGEGGVRLSGGQRQRIGIARALYNNPSILFFDEATSALDNETEIAIMDSINSLRGAKTMIIIAHRLTTIASCDHVYRVADGKINREDFNHDTVKSR